MSIPISQVDAFASRPFTGNPAAVCLLPEFPADSWLQAVASEMNLSETAFLVPAKEGFALRWFTPAVEVELCGHATLASAHFLWESEVLSPELEAKFETLSGTLTARLADGWIEMDFPAEPAEPVDQSPGLLAALGLSSAKFNRNRFDHLLEIEVESELRRLQPDFARLASLTERGVMVTCRSEDERFDFVSRFFAPAVGVDEDPVTGSAHCCLAPYWAKRLGRNRLVGYQASARGGVVRMETRNDRVLLAGQAVTVMSGQWSADAPAGQD